MAKPIGFMVIWTDGMGMLMPMGVDADCEGAIAGDENAPLVFPDRKAARHAITISERYARLREAQGIPHNEDFTTSKKNLRIVPVYAAPLKG